MSLFRLKSTLGYRLVRTGAISSKELESALERQQQQGGGKLTQHLVDLNYIDEMTLLSHMAEIYDLPVVGEEALRLDPEALEAVPRKLLENQSFLPLKKAGRTLSVAVADPGDSVLLKRLRQATGLRIMPVLARPSAIYGANRRRGLLTSWENTPGAEETRRYVGLFSELKDYELVRKIAEGGFGAVFQFHQISLDRPVAIKVLSEQWIAVQEVAQRFKKEGAIIARLDHPNIVKVYEQGEFEGYLYIIMEYFKGEPIDEALKGKNLVNKLASLRNVSSALEYAHSAGVIHRDIKPGNILMNPRGQVKLLDFGVAHAEAPGEARLTNANLVLGTPQFMAPELRDGARQASAQSDIYAFGIMAYEILTGRMCVSGELVHPSKVNKTLPVILGQSILHCLHSDASKRPRSFAVLSDTIQKSLDALMFGDTPAPANRSLDQTDRSRKLQSIDKRYEFQAILREEDKVRTIHAHHRMLNRDVIIKLFDKHVSGDKLKTIMAAKGPHIGEIYGAGDRDGSIIVIREFLDGDSLADRLKTMNDPKRIVKCLVAIVSGLQEALKFNLSHGNLHPDNVLFDSKGNIKVTDFGLASKPSPSYAHYRALKTGEEDYGDRRSLGALSFELLTQEKFNPNKTYEVLFERVARNTAVHPLLKYFLGRLWKLRNYRPAYTDYANMIEDLRRIQNRLQSRETWATDSVAPPDARPAAPKSYVGRALGRLIAMATVSRVKLGDKGR